MAADDSWIQSELGGGAVGLPVGSPRGYLSQVLVGIYSWVRRGRQGDDPPNHQERVRSFVLGSGTDDMRFPKSLKLRP